MRNRILYTSGALMPCLFFGWWWLPATPFAYWLLKRVLAILPTAASMRAVKEREAEGLFFLAALSGSLKAGLPLLSALVHISTILTSSLKGDIHRIYSLLLLGAEPVRAWSVLHGDRQLAEFGRAIASAQVDGRSLATVIERSATLSYESTLKRSRERVKSLSVKLALPVGLCFLPSFLIGGIGPIVYSFFASLKIF
jgi:Flp pilus assembly protein TadB